MSGTGQPGRQLELIRAARKSSIPAIEEVNPDAAVAPGPAWVVASVVGAAGGAVVVAVDVAAGLSGIGDTEIGETDDTCDGVDVAEPGGGAAVRELAVVALSDVTALAEDDVPSDEFATSDPPVEHAARATAAHSASSPDRPFPPCIPPPWHRSKSTAKPAPWGSGTGMAGTPTARRLPSAG